MDEAQAFGPDSTDMELVAAFKSGKYEAFEEIVRRYDERVFRLVRGFLGSDDEAHDASQEAFLSIYRALDGFRGQSKLGSWIYRIAVNTALMRIRKRKRRREVSLEATTADFDGTGHHTSPVLVDEKPASDGTERSELRDLIAAAVDELDEKYRTVFILRDIEGLSIAETAETMALTNAAVKTRLHRARLHLRASLERYVREYL